MVTVIAGGGVVEVHRRLRRPRPHLASRYCEPSSSATRAFLTASPDSTTLSGRRYIVACCILDIPPKWRFGCGSVREAWCEPTPQPPARLQVRRPQASVTCHHASSRWWRSYWKLGHQSRQAQSSTAQVECQRAPTQAGHGGGWSVHISSAQLGKGLALRTSAEPCTREVRRYWTDCLWQIESQANDYLVVRRNIPAAVMSIWGANEGFLLSCQPT
jgi:hypothetical protein